MKIGFLSDFFENQILGGAELNDGVLIRHLEKKYHVRRIVSSRSVLEDFYDLDYVIVSNFVQANSECLSHILNNVPYLIYEHDHKYVSNRDPSKFKNFVIPPKNQVNIDLYRSARRVVCLSSSQTRILHDNFGLQNLENISCSLWSQERFSVLRDLCTVEKNDRFAIMDSQNPIKNTKRAQHYCSENGIKYDLIRSPDQVEFVKKLSGYKGLVFFPGVLESLSRLCVEAKMLNCKLITIPKMLGASYEEWFSLSGIPLIETLEENVQKALVLFDQLVQQG